MTKPGFRHGTNYAYRTKRCRCEECRGWNARRVLAKARERGVQPAPPKPEPGEEHGTSYGYNSLKCRCDKCREWRNAKEREARRLNKLIRQLDLLPTEDEAS